MKKKPLKLFVQIIFFAGFFGLLANGLEKVWLGIFLVSVVAASVWGRFYCGWICPIHTATFAVSMLKKKRNKGKGSPIPAFLKKPWVRTAILVLFLAVFIFSEASGNQIPVLPILLIAAVLLTIIFPEALWHRYLCPYGTILRFPATKAKHILAIVPSICKDNNTCRQICPAEAVAPVDGRNRIDAAECLVCMRCVVRCKEKAISFH